MFLALRESQNSFKNGESEASVHKLRLAQMNIFKTCVIIVCLYLVAWLTLESSLLLYILGIYESLGDYHHSVGDVLVTLNSCVNPFIYAMSYEDFKKRIKTMISH